MTKNAQMCYTVCLVRYTGNLVFVREMIPICTTGSYNWFKPVKTSCLAETGWQKPNPGPE